MMRAKTTSRRRPRRSRRNSRAVVSVSSNIPTFRSNLPLPTKCTVPRSNQFLPDELDCWARTDAIVQYTGAAINSTTWKINGPYNLFGPQSNWAGAFSANVPAGSAELLQTTTAVPAGATGFYSSSTIQDADIELTITNQPASNSPACFVMLIPSLTASLAAVPTPLLREQRGVVVGEIPGQVGIGTPNPVPTKMKLSFSMADLFGVSRASVRENPVYAQIPLTDPAVLGYVHVVVAAVDGVTAINVNVRHSFTLHHLFRRPNVMNSATPI